MPFQLSLERNWQHGSQLAGPEDLVRPDGFRLLQNVRLDRHRGVLTNRPGMVVRMGAPLAGAPRMLGILETASGSSRYAQASTLLYRMSWSATTEAWGAPVFLISTPDTTLTSVNHIDGATKPWKFFVGNGLIGKDDGTTLRTLGLQPPAGPPAYAEAFLRMGLVINTCDATTSWGAFNASAFAVDTSIKQVGSGSLTFTVAASELGGINLGTNHIVATHTGPNGSQTLDDVFTDFLVSQVHRGALVTNVTQGGWSVLVSRVAQHQLFFVPSELGANVFNAADQYTIAWDLSSLWVTPLGASGTDNGGAPTRATTLIDTTKDFTRFGVVAGMEVENLTTGAHATITSIGTTTVPHDTLHFTGGLVGGTSAVMTTGNSYAVVNRLVDDDDWIQLYIRLSDTAHLDYLQIDFDIASSLYTSNYHSIRLSPEDFNPGSQQWTRLRLRKSQFQRYGSAFANWQIITGLSIKVQASLAHDVTVWVDDISLQGGFGLEGDVEYAAIYANEATGGLSAPPKTEDEVVITARPIRVDRQSVIVHLENIQTPADPQVTHLWIYRRRLDTQEDFTLVGTVLIGTATFYDDRSDAQLDLSRVLEADNDPPPANATVVFGPGALQRLFFIYNRNKVRFSKAWELHRFRSENCPTAFEFQIGDGSETAMNGIVMDQIIFVWTDKATWAVQGQGPDAFVPLPVPLSRGLAARDAVTFGDGLIFFLAPDGICEQRGVAQTLLTDDIAPFFQGQTVHGLLPLNRAAIGACKLVWKSHPTDPLLILLYPESGQTQPNRRLILKKDRQTGRYTNLSFDVTTGVNMTAALADVQRNTLFYGTTTGLIYEGEVETIETDAGVSFPCRIRTGARDDGAPRLVKTYSDVVVQAQTSGQTIATTAWFDHSTSQEPLLGLLTTSDSGVQELPLTLTTSPALQRRHHLALDMTWTNTARVSIFGLGWHVEPEAEDVTLYDTGVTTFPMAQAFRYLTLDADFPAPVQVEVFVNGVLVFTATLPATTGRTQVNLSLPVGIRGKAIRAVLTSTTFFLVWALHWQAQPEAEDVTVFDTGEITLPVVHALKYLSLDILASTPVTLELFVHGQQRVFRTLLLPVPQYRTRLNVLMPSGMKGKVFRVVLTATARFQVWALEAALKPWGVPMGYRADPWSARWAQPVA